MVVTWWIVAFLRSVILGVIKLSAKLLKDTKLPLSIAKLCGYVKRR